MLLLPHLLLHHPPLQQAHLHPLLPSRLLRLPQPPLALQPPRQPLLKAEPSLLLLLALVLCQAPLLLLMAVLQLLLLPLVLRGLWTALIHLCQQTSLSSPVYMAVKQHRSRTSEHMINKPPHQWIANGTRACSSSMLN